MNKDMKYLFDALWYGYSYKSSTEFSEKLHELAVKYDYKPIVDCLKDSGMYKKYEENKYWVKLKDDKL